MKKLSILFFALIASVSPLFAAATQIGDLYYNLNSRDKIAIVTYKSYNNSRYNTGWSITTANIPSSVTYNGTTYNVTSIGDNAFWGCSSLTSVTIPNSVTSIGDYAFCGCSSLTSVTIPNSVTSIGQSAFSGVPNIVYSGTATDYNYNKWGAKSVNGYVDGYLVYKNASKTNLLVCSTAAQGEVVIPSSVTCIGDYTFSGCTGLTSVTIPNSVTSIGQYAFYNCKGLTSVTIGNSVTSIGSSAFCNCSSLTSVNIPNSVTSIGWYAFQNCRALTSVTIPNSVRSIGNDAFSGCTGLTSVTMGNSVTSIGDDAFYYCSALTSVNIPNSVTSIGSSAFFGCTSLPVIDNIRYADTYLVEAVDKTLTTYNIKSGTRFIGSQAFSGCNSLTSVTIPNSVTSIGKSAFSGCTGLTSVTINSNSIVSRNYSADSNIKNIFGKQVTNYIIGNSVTSIGWYAFCGCYSLTSVTIGNSVTSIGNCAFQGCRSLTSVTIPNSVTSIGNRAFSSCNSLTSVTIPNSVTSIAEYAFDCSGLTSITCKAKNPPTLGVNVFYSVNKSIPLYVLAESVSAYKAAKQWKDFYSILPIGSSLDAIEEVKIEKESTKLLRSGQVLILRGDKTYTLTGQEIK